MPFALATVGLAASVAAPAHATGGTHIDDGARLLPKTKISIAQAVAASSATVRVGRVHEVDLEYFRHVLVFNVDVGHTDVAVDASTGQVLAVRANDVRRRAIHVERRHDRRPDHARHEHRRGARERSRAGR
jgi:hypothetical protein